MKILELREFLRVAQEYEAPRRRPRVEGTPSPCFLQEYDSIGVNRRGYAKDMILWELRKGRREVRLTGDSLKLKGQMPRELNAETQSARRALRLRSE
jgi:hypothetical protein